MAQRQTQLIIRCEVEALPQGIEDKYYVYNQYHCHLLGLPLADSQKHQKWYGPKF